MKNSEIILCNGIKLDKNYENVLSYNESSMISLCRNNSIYTGYKYAIIERDNTINISARYEDCIYANYMAFINPRYGDKWFFAWITDVKLLNPSTTQISFKIDVFSTWYSRFNIGKAFIEREHVSDDTIGLHTVPENLETGDYVISSYIEREIDGIQNQGYIVIGLSKLVEGFPSPSENVYNGIFSGLTYYILEDYQKARDFINALMETWGYDAESSIYCLYMIPRELITYSDIQWSTGSIGSNTVSFGVVPASYAPKSLNSDLTFSKGDKIDNYTPVNNKCFVFPYNYCYVTNNSGSSATYNFEDFLDGDAHFSVIGSIAVGASIRLDAIKYKNGFYNPDDQSTLLDNRRLKNYGLTCGKFPTCSWNSDSFTNWLTTNAVNIGLKGLASIGQAAVGATTGNLEGVISGATNIAGTVAEVYQHSLMPNQVEGNINSSDVLFSSNSLGFSLYRMTIKKEYCKIIDSYFSRFGYRVNEVKTPNLNSRTKFNFIKVGGMDELVSGNIPATDLEEINRIFRKGVTIFHNYSDIGNYTISNPIVTP